MLLIEMNVSKLMAIENLCPNCGLCCNGVLFADVELSRTETFSKLTKAGLAIENKTATKKSFAQPCSCFDGSLCRIYGDRPRRCRTFECAILKRVNEGKLTTVAALNKIRSARKQVAAVSKILGQYGQDTNNMALTKCFAEVMQAPIDLVSGTAESRRRGRLMRSMARLMTQLHKDFLQ